MHPILTTRLLQHLLGEVRAICTPKVVAVLLIIVCIVPVLGLGLSTDSFLTAYCGNLENANSIANPDSSSLPPLYIGTV